MAMATGYAAATVGSSLVRGVAFAVNYTSFPLHARISLSTSRCYKAGICSASSSAMDSPVVKAEQTTEPGGIDAVDGLDIRVGRIVKAWKHPDADSLYVEEVDLAEEGGPRTICSGLVKYVPEEELQGKYVAVLANLKPRNMKGIKSNGMLLAASDAAHENVELLVPPEGSQVGERIWFGGEDDQTKQSPPATPNQLQKKKIWETIQPMLQTNDDRVVHLENREMRTSGGVVKSKTLVSANVS